MKKNKKLFRLGLILLGLILSIFIYVSNLNVNAINIEYNEYNYLINIYELDYEPEYNEHYYLFNVIANIQNNTLIYIDGDNTGYAEKLDLNINDYGLYLVNASTLQPELNFYYYLQFNQVISYETYISNIDNFSYTTGYNNGFNDGYNDGNENGFNEGYNRGMTDFENFQSSIYYSNGYDNGYNEGWDLGYSAGINAQIPEQQFSLFNLLGVIFLFPFKLIAMGFDVDIFGVNVGSIIIGVMVISFIFAIFGIVRGKV